MTTIDANYQEWRFGRTDDYPDGPWKAEPDKIQWIDSATDLDCLIVRNRCGALCGYVGVPPQHPWHGKDYSECVGVCLTKPDDYDYCYSHSPDARTRVHGGLTFAARCAENREEGICHVPAPGRPHDVWWFGFDCAHSGDKMPSYDRTWAFDGDEYRDVAYVRSEIASLAQQLSDVARSAEL